VVPGANAARRAVADGLSLPEGLAPVYLHRQPGFAFDAALGDIAGTRDVATARWVAKTLQYPTDPQLAGPAWPWTLTLRPILLFAGGRRRRPGHPVPGPPAARSVPRRRPDGPTGQPADTSSNLEPSIHLRRRRS
jgi:hypothetical protein